tara:strand:- start:4792 stop:5115 length:324 start_codon:yes stop_codon:yes gene_type:complete
MSIFTTKPIKEIIIKEFKTLIANKPISISRHALDHLSESQRKVFKEEDLCNMLKGETPRKVYLQKNGRYAAYFRKKDGFRKLIIEQEKECNVIVTFADPPELPKIRL